MCIYSFYMFTMIKQFTWLKFIKDITKKKSLKSSTLKHLMQYKVKKAPPPLTSDISCTTTVNPVSGHSKRIPQMGFQGRLSINAGQKYCRMLKESILQYFRPSLSYHLSLKPFCPFLSSC